MFICYNRNVPEYLVFNEHYSVSVLSYDNKNNPVEQTLPEILSDSDIISKIKIFAFKIFNFNQISIRFNVEININNGLYSSVVSYFQNIAKFQKIGPSRAEVKIKFFYSLKI